MSKKKKELPAGSEDSLANPLKNWADKENSEAYKAALKMYKVIQRGFDNKEEQSDAINEYWNIYAATPDENQQYAGNSQGYIPAVRDAVHARAKRALKQLFPANNKYVDGLGTVRPHDEALYRERGKITARDGYITSSKAYLPSQPAAR